MPSEQSNRPKLYFLNERHQLAPGQKSGGGKSTKVVGVDWSAHGKGLMEDVVSLRAARKSSGDPTAQIRAYVLALPEKNVQKSSDAKSAKDRKKNHEVNIAGKQSQLIERLGFDLLAVTQDGSAIVHATDERLEQMMLSLGNLENLGINEQNKWAHIKRIEEIPIEYKTSLSWWASSDLDAKLEVVIDLQPYLKRDEIDGVINSISKLLISGERLIRTGKELNGRIWIVGELSRHTILNLAKRFQSIFSIHPPLKGVTVDAETETFAQDSAVVPRSSAPFGRSLPCVAVVDTGIPTDHLLLGQFIRGTMVAEFTGGKVCDSHGSKVASRIVYGEVECIHGKPAKNLVPACSLYDIRIGEGSGRIYPNAVEPIFGMMAASAPDVRVFNLSIDADTDVDSLEASYRDAWMRRIADLDNRIFSDDVLVVVAAGNSVPGVIPDPPYPRHIENSQWRLRCWSRCFNAITCGGTADKLIPDAVAKEIGSPSPFTRIGPGIAKSPKPDFSGNAGNANPEYQYQPGSEYGVWATNEDGQWEDMSGTSYAAPLLARVAAQTIELLKKHCESGSHPFACLVKACLALHAKQPDLSKNLRKLANHTLGYGCVDFSEIEEPNAARAIFLWQGIIPTEDDQITVEIPVPGNWIKQASEPVLRLFAAWDTPVNHAAEEIWACRKVELTIRPADGNEALQGKNRKGTSTYTLTKRDYLLSDELSNRDTCLMELRYTHAQMASYPSGSLSFSPQQRVGVAYELFDAGERPVSPHPFVQSLPVAASLNRLSTQMPASRQAISIKSF